MDFLPFKKAIQKQFERMQKTGKLYRVNIDRDVIWEMYLSAFPKGTNEIYRERREHDCSCCRQFVKNIGTVVAFVNGSWESIWDIDPAGVDEGYVTVASVLTDAVTRAKIQDVYLHYEDSVGMEHTFEHLLNNATTQWDTKQWDHFHVNLKPDFVLYRDQIPTKLGNIRETVQVFKRGLDELTDDAFYMVMELIDQGSLYRGSEFRSVVKAFWDLKKEYVAQDCPSWFPWLNYNKGEGLLRIRNSAIGTLLIDLSEGVDLEGAVRKWEAVMAPTNYKRPTAIVTPKMVEQAKEKVAELGLTSALKRRYATLVDIKVNNVLFADRNAKKLMTGDVFDDLSSDIGTKGKKLDKIEEISIEKFIKDVVPTATSIEVLMENRHKGNLVSLLAPEDPTSNQLFKWNNDFSWSYNGGFTDAIKERVKAAGGVTDADLCCRLAWDYTDDLDLHLEGPAGLHIDFGNRSHMGGQLDVDANGGDGMRQDPCENIFFKNAKQIREGRYTLYVHNYNKRDSNGVGFQAQIEFKGKAYNFDYKKKLSNRAQVVIAEFNYSDKDGLQIISSLPTENSITEATYQKVSIMLLSPNHWDEQAVGNKHYFFMLAGAKAEEAPRPFYNEFLKEELTPHRKVMEIIGSKIRIEDNDDQLTGLGFSSTVKNDLVVRVTGAFTRNLKIKF